MVPASRRYANVLTGLRKLTSVIAQKVYKWYSNRPDPEAAPAKKRKERLRLAKSYGVREVAAKMRPKRLEEILNELAEAKGITDTRSRISLYQTAAKQLHEELTEDEIKEFADIATQWNGIGAPPEEQRKYFAKHGSEIAKEFATMAFKHAGMRVLMLVAVPMEGGQVGVTTFDFNDSMPMDGEGTMPKKFAEMYPNWKKDPRGVYEMFREYSEKVMVDSGEGDEEEDIKTIAPIKWEYDEEGFPKLLSRRDEIWDTPAGARRFLWAFVTKTYRV
ncbi:hypothetical protein FOMPIDRAFT_1055589 [Fomitopsis schrenkii]|uniref:Uncharacterized protein n=1 Tax=Fomitopsis schrenkii TaxID=2126942 RepID=S8EW53_FOMSC|nr:hypothetical protein FOMPIDRAFT_1055589 [Fomitopsis schrenkii]